LENKEDGILREGIREFFGKKLPPKRHFSEAMNEDIFGEKREKFIWEGRFYTPRKELISTQSIEATISRSLNNLIKKDLLIKEKK
jgi:hypothetical protein